MPSNQSSTHTCQEFHARERMLDIFMLPIPYRGCLKSAYFADDLVRFDFYMRSVGSPGMVRAKSAVFMDESSPFSLIICDDLGHDGDGCLWGNNMGCSTTPQVVRCDVIGRNCHSDEGRPDASAFGHVA